MIYDVSLFINLISMNKRIFKFLPFVGLLLIFVVIFWPLLTGGAFLNTGVIYSDMWLFNYPLKDWYRELLLDGRLPFWTNLVGNGYPVFAEGQIGALYPWHLILFRLFPTLLAFNLNIFIHFFLAAAFTYSFASVSLKLSKPASVMAALIYSLSGFFVTHIHQINILMVIAYLPLILLSIERFIFRKRSVWIFILSIVFALQILAGHIEMFYYTSLLAFGWFVVLAFLLRGGKKIKRKTQIITISLFVFAFVMAVGINVVQILPTWELNSFSQRAEGLSIETASATVWPLNTLSLFVNPKAYDLYRTEPGYHPLTSTTTNIMALYGYVGLVPLLLILLAVVFWRKKYVVVFFVFLVLSFLYGLGRSTQLFTILWEVVPGLKFFRYPVKIMFFIEFCLAILAAFGLDFVRRKLDEKKVASTVITVVSLIIVSLVFIDLYANNVVRTRIIIPGKEWLAAPEAVNFLEENMDETSQRVYSHGTNNLDYQAARRYEMQLQFKNLLHVDHNVLYRVPENREWFVLFLGRQTNLNKQRTSLDTERGVLGLNNEFKKSLALQNVRYLVADLPIEDSDLTLVKEIPFSETVDHYAYVLGSEGPVTITVPATATYIYEMETYPRLMFTSSAKVIKDEDEVLDYVLSSVFDPTSEVVLEEDVNLPVSGEVNAKKLEITRYEEGGVEISIDVDNDGFLVMHDTFYPGWEAQVDGASVEIYRANYTFRAIPVKAGKHNITFIYKPTNWDIGLAVSGISLLIVFAGLGFTLIKKK